MSQKNQEHVLVIDDDKDVRFALSKILCICGYQVSLATGGIDGLMCIETLKPDLVLLDFDMPGLTGIDVLQTLRQTHSKLGLPVILVTGRSEQADVLNALNAGANDYVTKPVNAPILMARVATHLSMKTENDSYRRHAKAQYSIEKIEPGVCLAGRYEIEARISRGGFGDVFRARQISTGQIVAIKTIRNDSNERHPSDTLKHNQLRFETELRVLAQASHPHIVKLVDSGRLADSNLYLVLDYIQGEPLYKFIERRGPIPFAEAQRLMRQVLDALACAHRFGVIHSDVTPGNIMVSSTGMLSNAHVLDFGVVRLSGRSPHLIPDENEQRGVVIGTPRYMAPEQIERGIRTPQTDLFSWGLVFAECLIGKPMVGAIEFADIRRFYRGTLGSLVKNRFAHRELSAFFECVTAMDPWRRFATAESALLALDEVVKNHQGLNLNPSAPPPVTETGMVILASKSESVESLETLVDYVNPNLESDD